MLSTLKACALLHRRARALRGALERMAKSRVQTKAQIERAISYRLAIQNAGVAAIPDLSRGHIRHRNVPPLNRFRRTILSGDLLVSRTTSASTEASAYLSSYYSCFLSAKAVIKELSSFWNARATNSGSITCCFLESQHCNSDFCSSGRDTKRIPRRPAFHQQILDCATHGILLSGKMKRSCTSSPAQSGTDVLTATPPSLIFTL